MILKGLLVGFFLISSSAFAQVIPEPEIRDGSGLQVTTLEDSLKNVKPGQILVLGEEHGTRVHQAYQLSVLEHLRAQGFAVSVGMEFLESPTQPFVDEFREGRLSEIDFLAAVKWGGFPFEFYREQVLFPGSSESAVALNVPRAITSKIAKHGLNSLLPEDLAQLPANFVNDGRGNDLYFERFKTEMSGHITDPAKLENYFLAQSAWDDAMAWRATDYLKANPYEVLVIIVGDFHVRYDGGLPDRLKKWGAIVETVSMVNTRGMTEVEKQMAVTPTSSSGPRADWIWLADF